MLDFIKQYWLEALFTAILTVFTFVGKTLYSKVKKELKAYTTNQKKESEEQALLKSALVALLHDRLYFACQEYIKAGEITVDDLDNLGMMYEIYHALGGNGTGTNLYKRCCNLKIRSDTNAQQTQDGVF